MISTSVMVRKIAIGSLVPDSTSSVERTLVAHVDAADAQQEEHGGGIGGGDDGAEQA
jgi:hypothetical protein